ncbi:TPA: hypothetical protein ACGIK9_002781 [Acinetobacter baumannii]|uniref:hypothetical protein n=1 Tax=Acinetobacter baumannii TaxID=470 RepID=UPI00338F8511
MTYLFCPSNTNQGYAFVSALILDHEQKRSLDKLKLDSNIQIHHLTNGFTNVYSNTSNPLITNILINTLKKIIHSNQYFRVVTLSIGRVGFNLTFSDFQGANKIGSFESINLSSQMIQSCISPDYYYIHSKQLSEICDVHAEISSDVFNCIFDSLGLTEWRSSSYEAWTQTTPFSITDENLIRLRHFLYSYYDWISADYPADIFIHKDDSTGLYTLYGCMDEYGVFNEEEALKPIYALDEDALIELQNNHDSIFLVDLLLELIEPNQIIDIKTVSLDNHNFYLTTNTVKS